MDPKDFFLTFGISLGLGLLVGLQREYAATSLAGIRTFALITVFGTLCGFLAPVGGPWILAAGGIALAAVLVVGGLTRRAATDTHTGITTEVAALLMYAVGAYLASGTPGNRPVITAVVLGGAVSLLLQFKEPMHAFVQRLGKQDMLAIMQFVLVALVVLPILPNKTFGPLGVLNPRQVGWVIVLIVGISLVGYVILKVFGARAGMILGGVLGGVISSTATTISYARRTAGNPSGSFSAAVIIIIATTISMIRLMIELAAVAPSHVLALLLPLGVMFGYFALVCTVASFLSPRDAGLLEPKGNPAELKGAVIFGLMYAAMRLGVAAAKEYLPPSAMYGIAFFSGFVEIDALALSVGSDTEGKVGQAAATMTAAMAWRLVLTAFLSNLLFKVGAIALLGNRRLLLQAMILFAVMTAGGVAIIFLWPH